MSSNWLNYTCRVREADVEAVEACLEAAGAQAITYRAAEDTTLVFDQLDGRQTLWPVCTVGGLFDANSGVGGLEQLFRAAGVIPMQIRIENLAPRAWAESWRDHFKPQRFAERLCVCPSWLDPPWPDDVQIKLDPGMAFGTGNHATTAMCLEWLAASSAVAGADVLDYGCGSGILAIAAAKLGARVVWAVDIDTDALAVCETNAELNAMTEITTAIPAALEQRVFHVILANILLEPLLQLERRFAALLAPGGTLVVSGLLASQVEQLSAAYANEFTITYRQTSGDWALLAAARHE